MEDTLPIANTLIGFAGGLATAFFGERTSGGKRTSGEEQDEETISKEKVQKVVDSLSSPEDKKRFELLLSKKPI